MFYTFPNILILDTDKLNIIKIHLNLDEKQMVLFKNINSILFNKNMLNKLYPSETEEIFNLIDEPEMSKTLKLFNSIPKEYEDVLTFCKKNIFELKFFFKKYLDTEDEKIINLIILYYNKLYN